MTVPVYRSLIDAFLTHSVDRCFGLLGDGNLSFMMGMLDTPGMRVVQARHESSAVTMAAGFSRATGEVSLASVTAGPGLTHAITALTAAVRASLPLVLYAGDVQQEAAGPDSLQVLDHEAVARLTGAAYVRIDGRGDPFEIASDAIRRARDRRLPVLMSVPVDYAESSEDRTTRRETTGPGPLAATDVAGSRPSQAPAESLVREAEAALRRSRRPLFVIGTGAVEAGLVPTIRELAALCGARVCETFRAKGALDMDDPLSVGLFGPLAHAMDQSIQEQADLIIGLGADLHGFGAFVDALWSCSSYALGEEARCAEGPDNAAGVALAAALEVLGRTDPAPPDEQPWTKSRAWCEAVESDLAEFSPPIESGAVDPRLAMRHLDNLLPDDCVIVIGGGHFWSFPTMYLSKRRREFVFPIEFGSIGMALPTGIGCATATGRPVVVIDGDGGLMMGLPELESVVREGLDVTVVVINDSALGAEYHKAVARGFAPGGAAYRSVSFEATAQALGGQGRTIADLSDLEAIRDIGHEDPEAASLKLIDVRSSTAVTSRWYRRLYL